MFSISTPQSRKEKAEKHADLYRDDASYIHKKLYLTIPIAPSVNHMFRRTRNGGQVLTKEAERYFVTARATINQAIEEQVWIKQEHAVWYYIDMVVYMPDRRIRDSHNMLKILMDVLQGVVYQNDYYALSRIQGVEYDKENPRIEICVSTQTKADRQRAMQIVKPSFTAITRNHRVL